MSAKDEFKKSQSLRNTAALQSGGMAADTLYLSQTVSG